MTKKQKLLKLMEFRKQANGRCNGMCPGWECSDCHENFGWLPWGGFNWDVKNIASYLSSPCPCNMTKKKYVKTPISPEVIFARLDEVIEELQEEVLKEDSA